MRDGRRRGKQGGGELDLLVTITIELLYKAPLDNIGGITQQRGSPVSLKKALLVLGGDKGSIRAGTTSVSSLCVRGGVQSGSPVAPLGFINFCI